MSDDLQNLRIDRSERRNGEPSRWAVRWIVIGIAVFVVLGAGRFIYARWSAATEVEIARVRVLDAGAGAGNVILNATGYIVAAHKIELASKVVGKVAWIGVEKGDRVKKDQVLVRLENDEYRAQFQQYKGNLEALQAKLAEMEHGSRPEELAKAKADVERGRGDLGT